MSDMRGIFLIAQICPAIRSRRTFYRSEGVYLVPILPARNNIVVPVFELLWFP